MKTGFFDESYNTEFFVLAGWIFCYPTAPARYSRRFRAECAKHPQCSDFHMQPSRDALSAHWRWGTQEHISVSEKFRRRDRRYLNLQKIISTYKPRGFSIVLDRRAYDAVYRGKVPKSRDSEYFVMFYHMLFSVAKFYVQLNQIEPIQFTFDEQDAFRPQVMRWYPIAVQDLAKHEPRAAKILSLPPTFQDDAATIPLKAADMLAWLVLRLQSNNVSDEIIVELLAMAKAERGHAGKFFADELTHLRDIQRPDCIRAGRDLAATELIARSVVWLVVGESPISGPDLRHRLLRRLGHFWDSASINPN